MGARDRRGDARGDGGLRRAAARPRARPAAALLRRPARGADRDRGAAAGARRHEPRDADAALRARGRRARTTSSATRSASSRRSPPPSRSAISRGDRAGARARPRDGGGRAGSARARWPRCSASPTRWSSGSAARSSACGRRTTTARARSSSPARPTRSRSCCARPRHAGARRAIRLKVSGAFHSPLVARRGRAAAPGDRRDRLPRAAAPPFMSTVTASSRTPADRRAPRRPADRAGAVHAGRRRAGQATASRRSSRSGPATCSRGLVKRIDRSVQAISGQRPRTALDEAATDALARDELRLARGEDRARHRRLARHRPRDRAASSRAAGATVVVGYRSGADEAEALARRRPAARAVQADVVDPAEARARSSRRRATRHPRQQRRHHARRPARAHDGRGLATP